ncbi:MAG: ABC transporter permease, partial [Muribaculaceae bacterium]|nr:ABC transporter permease [Muribaculaceae bacterium]
MEKLKLIIAREYKSIVARKSFIVITLLLPVLMVALMALPAFLAWINDAGSEAKVVAVVDHSGGYG